MLWLLISSAVAYLALALIVGRILLFNDLLRRRKPRSDELASRHDVEEIEFHSFRDIVLRGWFVRAAASSDGRSVIVVHGWQCDRSSVIPHIELLADAGFHVLAYDQRGHGASDTALLTYGAGEAGDLLAAVNYLKGRGDVDPQRIAAVGFSLGSGGIVYALAAAPDAFRAVVLEGVFSDSYDVGLQLLRRRVGSVAAHFIGWTLFTAGAKLWTLGSFRHSRPVDFAPRLASTPMLIIRGANDFMVPEESAAAFIRAVPDPKDVWRNEKGRHSGSYRAYPEEYRRRVIGFLETHLGDGTLPPLARSNLRTSSPEN